MSTFSDIKLHWRGDEYVIPANKVLGAIARIEAVVTLPEIFAMLDSNRVKMTTVAQAYAGVLNYAGAEVSPDDVYTGMFEGKKAQKAITDSVITLLMMMVPPSSFASKGLASATQGNVPRKARRASAARSRKKPSRSR